MWLSPGQCNVQKQNVQFYVMLLKGRERPLFALLLLPAGWNAGAGVPSCSINVRAPPRRSGSSWREPGLLTLWLFHETQTAILFQAL